MLFVSCFEFEERTKPLFCFSFFFLSFKLFSSNYSLFVLDTFFFCLCVCVCVWCVLLSVCGVKAVRVLENRSALLLKNLLETRCSAIVELCHKEVECFFLFHLSRI